MFLSLIMIWTMNFYNSSSCGYFNLLFYQKRSKSLSFLQIRKALQIPPFLSLHIYIFMVKSDLQHRGGGIKHQQQGVSRKSKHSQEGDYQCEAILDIKIVKGHRFYLIKWKGYEEQDNTWEPVENVLTISSDILEFQNQKKQYIKQIESKWNLMYLNRQVMEPLAKNQLKKIEKEAKKIKKNLEIEPKKLLRKRRKIKKTSELRVRSRPLIFQQLKEKQTRNLRSRINFNPIVSKKGPHEQALNNQSSCISNSSFPHFSSQILNSAFFEQKKCENQVTPPKQKQIVQQPTLTVKKQSFKTLEVLKNQEEAKQENKQQQKNAQGQTIQQIKPFAFSDEAKPAQKDFKKQSKLEVHLENNYEHEQLEKPKENNFKTSNYFFQTPKKNPIYCCNSPIQRSLNKYIYRIKPKHTTNSNEKASVQANSYYEAPVKDSFNEIISQKAEELQSSQNIKKDQLEDKENSEQMQAFNPIDPIKDDVEAHQNSQDNLIKLNDDSSDSNEENSDQKKQESERVAQDNLVDCSQNEEVINVQQSNQNNYDSVKEIKRDQTVNNNQKPNLQIVIASESSHNEDQSQSHNEQPSISQNEKTQHKKLDGLLQQIANKKFIQIPQVLALKSNYLSVKKQQEHKTNLCLQQGLHYIIDQFQSNQYLKQSKVQLSRIIEDTGSRLQPCPKSKKIVKTTKKNALIRHFSKKKGVQQENDFFEKPSYDLTSILMSCISSQELRNRQLKLDRIISMFKLEECSIFVVLTREGNYLEQRFIAYNLMRDYYPRALLRYLQQNGKIQI